MEELNKEIVKAVVKSAIKEDMPKGDITTDIFLNKTRTARARIFVREKCILCGIDVCGMVFKEIDKDIKFSPQAYDGDDLYKGTDVAFIEGHARSILRAERLALNFLSFLSGVASEAKKYRDIAAKHGVKILDTRKTIPLLRHLEKYAVTVGGGYNHRMNLSEMVLIKDNHLKLSDYKVDLKMIRKKNPKVKIEIEADNLKTFETVLKQRPDIIMLDNMNTADIKKAVAMRNASETSKEVMLEASGGITVLNLEEYAKTGVDMISIGAITDSVKAVDFSLDIIK